MVYRVAPSPNAFPPAPSPLLSTTSLATHEMSLPRLFPFRLNPIISFICHAASPPSPSVAPPLQPVESDQPPAALSTTSSSFMASQHHTHQHQPGSAPHTAAAAAPGATTAASTGGAPAADPLLDALDQLVSQASDAGAAAAAVAEAEGQEPAATKA